MPSFGSCSDLTDIKPLSEKLNLFLKPLSSLNISVHYSSLKFREEIPIRRLIEEIKEISAPGVFASLKVSKTCVEFIRFEGELSNRSRAEAVLSRINGKTLKISSDSLKVKASLTKDDTPVKHDWDKFFRDTKNMNELKPGERPDTVVMSRLPNEWFADENSKVPSEEKVKMVFQQFGEIRAVDIPSLDPYRKAVKMDGELFDTFIQYNDYLDFVRCIEAFRAMKLLKRTNGKGLTYPLKVDFDRTKHLSAESIRRRKIERDKRMTMEQQEKDKAGSSVDSEEAKLQRRKDREERRKTRILRRLQKKETHKVRKKIATEEKLLLVAQRKLESIRLLNELFERLKEEKQKLQRDPGPSLKGSEKGRQRSPGKWQEARRSRSPERKNFQRNSRWQCRGRPRRFWNGGTGNQSSSQFPGYLDPQSAQLYYKYFKSISRKTRNRSRSRSSTSSDDRRGRSWSSSSRKSGDFSQPWDSEDEHRKPIKSLVKRP